MYINFGSGKQALAPPPSRAWLQPGWPLASVSFKLRRATSLIIAAGFVLGLSLAKRITFGHSQQPT